MRQDLLDKGLVTNPHEYKWYNGIWANVKTRHLDEKQLQYLVWLHRQKIMGWWEPSERAKRQGRLWVPIWTYAFRPLLKFFLGRRLKKLGWEGRYQLEMKRHAGVNVFKDLEAFIESVK
jgi:hypothetical protein